MLGKIARLIYKRGHTKVDTVPQNIWSIKVRDIEGKEKELAELKKDNKAFLFVNVASGCGFTGPNYRELQQIYDQYHNEGLEILGFPCNQFGGQESACELDISKFVKEKFKVTFPMFEKVEVNGENSHELYKYLKSNSELKEASSNTVRDIPWNFTKFLVDRQGYIRGYFLPDQNPRTFAGDITKVLTE